MARKCVIEISDRISGWSETYYFADGATFTPRTWMEEVRDQRLKVLGAGCYITAIKISRTTEPKVVHLFSMEREGRARNDPNGTGDVQWADQSHVCVLMPFFINSGGKRIVTVSGIPDSWILRDAELEGFMRPTNVAATALNAWYNYLLRNPTLQARVRQTDGNFAKTAIDGVTVLTNGRYKITSALAANLALGDKVTLTKLAGNNLVGLGGLRKVTEIIDATSFTVDRGPRGDLGVVTYLGGGFAQKVGYTFSVCSEAPEPYVVSTRKRGRPFSKRRGRRSAKR